MTPRSKPTVAVITGTGVTDHFGISDRRTLRTKFGSAVAFLSRDRRFYILPRHGPAKNVPPHMIDYRANIAGLRGAGVTAIIATSAVGSMEPKFSVGEFGLVEQFLDFTKARRSTFFEETVSHTDMTTPYSGRLNGEILRAATSLGVRMRGGLVYVCVEGPRYETAAEIKMFRRLGGDVVGMTGVPEVVLANEMGMEYASIAIATNWAAGIQEKVSHDEVLGVMKRSGETVRRVVEATVNLLVGEGSGRGERRPR